MTTSLPRYDPTKTYRWNYDHAPAESEIPDSVRQSIPPAAGEWDFCGTAVASPIGIAAGPLLNGKWCLYYAALGFDVVTYKTVRSGCRECYPPPNLLPVDACQLDGSERQVFQAAQMAGSWAVSFGMPSSTPEVWRRDVQWTRDQLPSAQVLSVSVVGTVQEGWGMEELGEDYGKCARWAVESGADCIETNFSCPNVATCDGQLYQTASQAQLIAQIVRDQIGDTPLVIKIGHLQPNESAAALVDAVAPFADALAMTNSIATKVVNKQASEGETVMFDGQQRGICGDAIRDASVAQVRRFREMIEERNVSLKLIGVGGIAGAEDVQEYLTAGAHACHLATAPMINPLVGIEIRRERLTRA